MELLLIKGILLDRILGKEVLHVDIRAGGRGGGEAVYGEVWGT
jgi:hypothetical protein